MKTKYTKLKKCVPGKVAYLGAILGMLCVGGGSRTFVCDN